MGRKVKRINYNEPSVQYVEMRLSAKLELPEVKLEPSDAKPGFKNKSIQLAFKNKSRIRRIPVIGKLARHVAWRLRERELTFKREMPDINHIWHATTDDFIGAVFDVVLNREPDRDAVINCRWLLSNGMPRPALAYMLSVSKEGQEQGIPLTIYRGIYIKWKIKNVFKRIWILLFISNILRLPGRVRHLNAQINELMPIQAQLFDLIKKSFNKIKEDNEEQLDAMDNYIVESKKETEHQIAAFQQQIQHQLDDIRQTYNMRFYALHQQTNENLRASQEAALHMFDLQKQSIEGHGTSLRQMGEEQKASLQHMSTFHQHIVENQQTWAQQIVALQYQLNEVIQGDIKKAQDTLLESQDKSTKHIEDLQHESASLQYQQSDNLRENTQQIRDDLAFIGPTVSAIGQMAVVQVDDLIIGLLNREWILAAHINFRGYPEPGSVKVFKEIVQPGMRVIDVGANYGIYTLLAARQVGDEGRVWSVEPTPEVYTVLINNIWVNGFKESDIVTTCRVAASDVNGTVKFGTSDIDSGHNSLFPEADDNKIIEVQAVRLDDYLSDVSSADVIKIDIEGAEPNALRGLERIISNSPGLKMLMEWCPSHLHRNFVDLTAWLNELRALGFSIQAIDEKTGDLWQPSDEELIAAGSINLLLEK